MDKNPLKYLSARHQIGLFLIWVKSNKNEAFSYAIFNRAKVSDPEDLTDRQRLLYEYALEFKELDMKERMPLPEAEAARN
jgi:hypothetical protein